MSRNCVFFLPPDCRNMISTFKLEPILSNPRTSIYQNSYARFSIDKKVVRVLLFDENDKETLEKIRQYFYGEKYGEL